MEVSAREVDADTRIKAVEEMLKQTEEDADKEILELKTKYEKTLRFEKESNVRYTTTSSIIKLKNGCAES